MSFLLIFLAGCFEGILDTLQFHWAAFKNIHRSCNSWFWCPVLSWRRKYKDNDPSKGEKFFGSTTVFVWVTDAWHLFKMLRNVALFSAFPFFVYNCIPISNNIWLVILYAFGMYGINRLGFNMVYKLIYK